MFFCRASSSALRPRRQVRASTLNPVSAIPPASSGQGSVCSWVRPLLEFSRRDGPLFLLWIAKYTLTVQTSFLAVGIIHVSRHKNGINYLLQHELIEWHIASSARTLGIIDPSGHAENRIFAIPPKGLRRGHRCHRRLRLPDGAKRRHRVGPGLVSRIPCHLGAGFPVLQDPVAEQRQRTVTSDDPYHGPDLAQPLEGWLDAAHI